MEGSKSMIGKGLHVMYPKEEGKVRIDLLDELLLPMTEVIGEDEREKFVLVRLDQMGEATEEQKDKEEEEDYEAKRVSAVADDDIPKADFFDAKEDAKEVEYYGEIEGMVEVTEDDDEFQYRARELSTQVQSFEVESPMRSKRPSVRSIRESVRGIRSSVRSMVDIESSVRSMVDTESSVRSMVDTESSVRIISKLESKPIQEEGPTEEEKEEEKEAKQEEEKEAQQEEKKEVLVQEDHVEKKTRPSRITMASVDLTIKDNTSTTSINEGIEGETRKTTDKTKTKSIVRQSRIYQSFAKELTLGRISGVSATLPRESVVTKYSLNQTTDSEEDLMGFLDNDAQEKFLLPDYYGQEYEEEDKMLVIEEESYALNRMPYYEKYDLLVQQIGEIRMKNNILQKKVIMYFRRRKIDNFTREGEFHLDQLQKFHQKLDIYQQLLECGAVERKTMNEELDILKKARAFQNERLEKAFKTMQTREANIGNGLIFSKTGVVITQKVVDRLLKRQKIQMDQVSSMRLKYIKLKGMVQEKLDGIEKRDKLENNLRLTDYEQLKAENRRFFDKIEEREEELTRLRAKCQNTIQILAHMREKTAALETDVDVLREEQEYLKENADTNRTLLAVLKHKRDKYRNLTEKIKGNSGLLIESNLLRDMQESIGACKKVQEELTTFKEEYNERTIQIRNLRKNIGRLVDALDRKKRLKAKASWSTLTSASLKSRVSFRSNASSKAESLVYQKRPTLRVPTIPLQAFEDLVVINPTPMTLTRKRR